LNIPKVRIHKLNNPNKLGYQINNYT